MTTGAIIFMIVICGLVWGGFLTFLGLVWRFEKRKHHIRGEEPPS